MKKMEGSSSGCRSMKIPLLAAVLLLTTLAALSPAAGQDCGKGDLENSRQEIERLEDMLARPCTPAQEVMEELIKYGLGYQRLALERATAFSEGVAELDDGALAFSAGSDKREPGGLVQGFNGLKEAAEKAGLLGQGPRPKGISYTDLSMIDGSEAFLFFEKDEAKAAAMTQQVWHLEEELESLRSRWGKEKAEYEQKFSDGYFEKLIDKVETPVKVMYGAKDRYLKLLDRLRDLVNSKKYEHCLGPVSDVPSYQSQDALYTKGAAGEFSAIPGAGFQFPVPKLYPRLKRYAPPPPPMLYFKHDGNRLQKARNELLQEQIRAEKEQMQILADWDFGLGKHIVGQENMVRLLSAAQSIKDTVETLHAMAVQITHHPIKTTADAVKAIGNISIQDINKLSKEVLPQAIITLAGTMAEDVKDVIDPGRFTVTGDMSETKKGEIYGKQLESVKTINKSLQSQGEFLESAVEFFAGISAASKTGKLLDVKSLKNHLAKGADDPDVLDLKTLLDREKSARQALARYRSQKKLANIDGDTTPEASTVKNLGEDSKTAQRTAADVLKDLDKCDALDQELLEMEAAGLKRLEPSPRKFEPPEKNTLKIEDKGGDVPEGTFSKVVVNKDNPDEVIKYPVSGEMVPKYEQMIERQLKGNKYLDELGIDNARITTTGTAEVKMPDGSVKRVPMLTQEKVDKNSIMENLINKQDGKLDPDQQVAFLDMIQRANEKGILLGDIKDDNIFFTKGESGWKCGILDPDFIAPPSASALEGRSLAELQWTQISGKIKMKDEIWKSPFASNALMAQATGGGSSGGMAKYLSEEMMDLIKEPDKLKGFLKEKKTEKVKETLAKNEGYRKLTDERKAVAERIDAGAEELNKVSDKLEENTGTYKAWLEKKAKEPETPDTKRAEDAARSYEEKLDEGKRLEKHAMAEKLLLDGIPEEDIEKLFGPRIELPDAKPPSISESELFSLDEDFFGFSKGGKR
ncbi:MAG: hypothetical protein C4576_23530 [Desulfobacteraceae bacterium]|nr:MAG: hypothetical protein C4576_23530 [Desulfobacteraceae bacterium]